MKKFILVRQSDGFIKMMTSAPVAEQVFASPGEVVVEVTADPSGPITEFKWDFSSGGYAPIPKRPSPHHEWDGTKWKDPRPPVVAPPPTVEQARAQMYPSVQAQLDMLWHAMDNGQLPKAEPFYSTIKQVKTANPKPAQEKVWPVGKN